VQLLSRLAQLCSSRCSLLLCNRSAAWLLCVWQLCTTSCSYWHAYLWTAHWCRAQKQFSCLMPCCIAAGASEYHPDPCWQSSSEVVDISTGLSISACMPQVRYSSYPASQAAYR
jgi:hypothetical protein